MIYYEKIRAAKFNENASLSEIGIVDEGSFWHEVATNLSEGKLRLLFVVDEMPHELQRIIEYLNSKMRDTEVLGLEISRFSSKDGLSLTLVPRVYGYIDSSQPNVGFSGVWNESLFIEELEKRYGQHGNAMSDICKNIIVEFTSMGCDIRWGKGKRDPTFIVMLRNKNGTQSVLFWVYLMKKVNIQMAFVEVKNMADKLHLKLLVECINGVSVQSDRMNSYPSFVADILTVGDNFNTFVNAYKDWLIYADEKNVYKIDDVSES